MIKIGKAKDKYYSKKVTLFKKGNEFFYQNNYNKDIDLIKLDSFKKAMESNTDYTFYFYLSEL